MTPATYAILGDSPVSADGDRLNFNTFVQPFADRLINSVANSPFAVGIFADWGQGKSTVMQMLNTAVRAKDCPTIWFEPWKHNTREGVWKGLALTLVTQIRNDSSLLKEIKRKKRNLLVFGAKALWGRLIGREWAQDLIDSVQKEPWSPSLLHEFEENLATLFEVIRPDRKSGTAKPLVLFVDDVDRCLPDAALAVLEALKLVLNRPGLITVMGIAESELSRAVLAAYGKEMKEARVEFDPQWGQKYIRKIIQMPFPLPVISEKSFDNYIGSCLADSNVGPALNNDDRWKEIIRDACESNLREVKRFINHFISEVDKASANVESSGASPQTALDPPRIAFVLLLAWRFGDFLSHIRKQAGERDLLVKYQIFFAQQLPGGTIDPSILPDGQEQFQKNVTLAGFFNRCFASDSPLALPFTDWNDIEPYLQFGIRSPKTAPSAKAAAGRTASEADVSPPSPRVAAEPPHATSGADAPAAVSSRSEPPPPSESAKEFAARIQPLLSAGRFEEARHMASEGIQRLQQVGDRSGEAILWGLIGNACSALKKVEEASEAYGKALEIALGIGAQRDAMGMLSNLARLHLSDDPRKAMHFAERGLEIAKRIADALGENNALVDRADAYEAMADFELAEADYRAALEIAKRLRFVQGELLILGRLSLMYSDIDPKRARDFNAAALEVAEKLGDKQARLRLLANRAQIERELGAGGNPLEYLKRAIALADELGNADEKRTLQAESESLANAAPLLERATSAAVKVKPKSAQKPRAQGRRLK